MTARLKSAIRRAVIGFASWAIDKYAPTTFIYGRGLSPRALVSRHVGPGESVEAVAAMALLYSVHGSGRDWMQVTMDGVTHRGEEMGDWEIIIRKVEGSQP